MKKLYLIDGTYELFRAFFAAPEHQAENGLEVGAVRGALYSLMRLLREEQVEYAAVTTDHVVESFRNDLFDGYKTGEGLDPILYDQFVVLEEGVSALGILCLPMIEFEADDGIAAAAAQFYDDFDQIIIASPDKDMMQCVNDKVISWDRRREKFYDSEAVFAKMGVPPQSIPDYLGLVGDTADGIPGLPGWGAKSAATVLAEYKKIENVPREAENVSVKVRGKEKLLNTLFDNYEDALLYRKLAVLRTDIKLPPLEKFKFNGTPKKDWLTFCQKYNFTRLNDAPHNLV